MCSLLHYVCHMEINHALFPFFEAHSPMQILQNHGTKICYPLFYVNLFCIFFMLISLETIWNDIISEISFTVYICSGTWWVGNNCIFVWVMGLRMERKESLLQDKQKFICNDFISKWFILINPFPHTSLSIHLAIGLFSLETCYHQQ